MIMGINQDVLYSGQTYHVQSEVNREAMLCIQLFRGGVLLHLVKVPSAEVRWNDEHPTLAPLLQRLLRERHERFVCDLLEGRFDGYIK